MSTLKEEIQKKIQENEFTPIIIDIFGQEEQEKSIARNTTMQGIISAFKGEDEPIYQHLKQLQLAIEKMNPNHISAGFFGKLFKLNPFKRYLADLQQNQAFIDEVLKTLEDGQQRLKRDNIAFELEIKNNLELLQDLKVKLTEALEADEFLAQLIDQKIENIERISQSFIFPLKQRIIDIQQQIMVHEQGELAIASLMENNRQLINSIERTKAVTLNALNVAIIVAQGLATQKKVLDSVEQINTQTSDLILHTSQKLKEQGTHIQQRASSALLDMDKLKVAYENVLEAMKEVEEFRLKSIPIMSEQIKSYQHDLAELESKKIILKGDN
ncbi:hypothetical protein CCZ01_06515 [Helicobacter monodelphidis]|uniref:toxic anion resistance protein n=1 Tax=Helicobacter sp. 15-1451 TaxID=2004995 RepID=UPI000DCC3A6E|nr:toxic anion resistance protein [Helicobacter sp. 15-1451]RAX57345.1 hypothetical protein CCZ01_06515 [Helicobacter sp. 15-1451]